MTIAFRELLVIVACKKDGILWLSREAVKRCALRNIICGRRDVLGFPIDRLSAPGKEDMSSVGVRILVYNLNLCEFKSRILGGNVAGTASKAANHGYAADLKKVSA